MKGLYYILLIAVFLTGCGTSQPSIPILQVNDKTIPVVLHGYSWKGGIFTKPTSVTPVNTPPKIAEKNKPTEVPPEAKLIINFNNPPQVLEVELWKGNETKKISLIDTNSIVLPKEKGGYVYQIISKWEEGTASYVFTVEVPDTK